MHFDQGYRKQLFQQYPEDIVRGIADHTYQAELPHDEGQTIPYTIAEPEQVVHERPVLYVPGFGCGIVNKASFAASMALRGTSFVLPGQNRHRIQHDPIYGRDPVVAQAKNYLAVLDRAVAKDQTPNIVAHSFGAMIFERMVDLDPDRFTDTDVVFLAPAGSIHDETKSEMSRRWVGMVRSEMDKNRPMAFPDNKGVTGRASALVLASNVARTKQEVHALATHRINYPKLVPRLGSLTILSFAEDKMFPADRMFSTLSGAVEAGASWRTPVSPQDVIEGRMKYGGDGAVHDDEQYNPGRVADAVVQALSR